MNSVWLVRPPAAETDLNAVESHTGIKLPDDYRTFMRWSNGGEGLFPKIYISLWQVEQIVKLNSGYIVQHYLGNKVLAIGSDGGPICLLLDYKEGDGRNPSFAAVDFGDLDPAEVAYAAPTFTNALEMALAGTLDGDNL